MASEEGSGSVDSVVQSVLESLKAQMASLSTGVHLALTELRVVVSHAGLIICLLLVAAGMMVAGWVLILVIGVLLLMGIGLPATLALLCMFLVNIIALVVIGITIRYTIEHLSFRHTRQALARESSELGYTL